MARKPKPIEETPAWDIYLKLKAWILEHQAIPKPLSYYSGVLVPAGTTLTRSQYTHWFNRLVGEGFIEIDKQMGAMRLTELSVRSTWSPEERAIPDAPPGYVYILKGPFGYYKIGLSAGAGNRIKQLEIQLPFKIEIECVIECDRYARLERDLHQRYADKRANGEWFTLTAEDIEAIKQINPDDYSHAAFRLKRITDGET